MQNREPSCDASSTREEKLNHEYELSANAMSLTCLRSGGNAKRAILHIATKRQDRVFRPRRAPKVPRDNRAHQRDS